MYIYIHIHIYIYIYTLIYIYIHIYVHTLHELSPSITAERPACEPELDIIIDGRKADKSTSDAIIVTCI